MNEEILRDKKEKKAFIWLAILSIPVWLLLILWIATTFGALLLIIGIIAFCRRLSQLMATAYIKTNAVQVSENQFPEINSIITNFSSSLGKTPPQVYIMQSSIWNSFAMILAGKRIVVLLSGALDPLLESGSIKQVAWLIGHELGHHYSGHLDFWKRTISIMGSWFFWIGLWYKRRCELTCDKYGLLCSGNMEESLRAICNFTVGEKLAATININKAIEQWDLCKDEFFVKYRTLYTSHPHNLWRLKELKSAAQELGIS